MSGRKRLVKIDMRRNALRVLRPASSWLMALLLATPAATAAGVDSCPTLPADSGLQWTYQDGPDFGVCYASPVGTDESVFGIYLGNFPSFHPERSMRVGKGKVAGRSVEWYRQEESAERSPFARQTLVTLDRKRGNVAHVWVMANNQEELQARLAILERIVFKQ